jgi:hypothetical protein
MERGLYIWYIGHQTDIWTEEKTGSSGKSQLDWTHIAQELPYKTHY